MIASLLTLIAMAPPQTLILSDEALRAYAAQPYDKAAVRLTHEVVGRHRGVSVVVDYICSDICPDYTVRIIHYDVEPGGACDRAGGVSQLLAVPTGPAMGAREFCMPKILVERPR
jgi:hypothetical protein